MLYSSGTQQYVFLFNHERFDKTQDILYRFLYNIYFDPRSVEKMNCSDCKKEFTKVSRKEIKCPHCPFSVCKSCVSKHIRTNKSVPHCRPCNIPFKEEYLKGILSKTVFEICYKNQYKIEEIKVIGSGGFGKCSLVKREEKMLVMKKPLTEGLEDFFFSNEINLHKLLDHPNIVPFYDSFIKRRKSHILLYPCIHGS